MTIPIDPNSTGSPTEEQVVAFVRAYVAAFGGGNVSGIQNPLTADLDGGGHNLLNFDDIEVSGLTGATAGARFVGGTTSGHPTTGTFVAGDFVVDKTGAMWICTVGGTPGTWVESSGTSSDLISTGLTDDLENNGFIVSSTVRRSAASFGAECDGRMLTGITVNSTAVTSGSSVFTSADVGRTLCVFNANGSGIIGQGVVTAYITATHVTLDTALTASSKAAVLGTDDTAAWQAAIDWAMGNDGGVIEWDGHGTGISVIAGDQVTGTAFTYSYSGQLLIPANGPYTNQPFPTVEIAGTAPMSGYWNPVSAGGGLNTAPVWQQGLVLFSTATSGFVIDCVPYSLSFDTSINTWAITWAQLNMKRLTVRKILGSAAGGVNLNIAVSCNFEEVSIDVWGNPNTTIPTSPGVTSNAGVGLLMPGDGSWALCRASVVSVVGYAKGMAVAEHAHLHEVSFASCGAALAPGTYPIREPGSAQHSVRLDRALIQNCRAAFEPVSAKNVTGFIEMEPGPTGATFINDSNFYMTGNLYVNEFNILGPLDVGVCHPNLVITTGDNNNTPTPSTPMQDDFTNRVVARTQANWGLSQTNHIYYSQNMAIDSSGAYFSAADVKPEAVVINGPSWRSMRVSGTIHTSSTSQRTWAGLMLRRQVVSHLGLHMICSNNPGGAGSTGVLLYKGEMGGTATLLASASYTFATGTDYALDFIILDDDPSSWPIIQAYVSGFPVLSYQLTAAEGIAYNQGYTPIATTCFGLTGWRSASNLDNGNTRFKNLYCTPVRAKPYSRAGTATLVSGTKDVTDTAISANSIIRLERQATGGTLGHLSVALTAATKFTINSSSATDTSTVYYEIVSY